MPFAHQMRPQFREFPLPKLGKAVKQFLAGDERQHRVPQELKLLIIPDPVLALPGLLRLQLARLRTMRDRLLDHRPPPKVIPEPLFERRDFPFLHRERRCPTAPVAVPLASRPERQQSGEPVFPPAGTNPESAFSSLVSSRLQARRTHTSSVDPAPAVPPSPPANRGCPWSDPPPAERPSTRPGSCFGNPAPEPAGRPRSHRVVAEGRRSTFSDSSLPQA